MSFAWILAAIADAVGGAWTGVVKGIADASGDALRALMFELLSRVPLWVLVVVGVILVLLFFAGVFVLWVCCVYMYRGLIELRDLACKVCADFTWSLEAGFDGMCAVLLFMYRIPTNICLLLAVLKESVQYAWRTILFVYRHERNDYYRARARLIGGGFQNRARMLSPGRVRVR
jgi:hypothetical protein